MRCLDGGLVKGYVGHLSPGDEAVTLEKESSGTRTFAMNELKAIFFVRTFEGERSHIERKTFATPVSLGKRVFVKFKDGKCMTGYIEGGIPWEKGFFLEPNKGSGFFLIPADGDSNNVKVFVVASSVWDVTVMG